MIQFLPHAPLVHDVLAFVLQPVHDVLVPVLHPSHDVLVPVLHPAHDVQEVLWRRWRT